MSTNVVTQNGALAAQTWDAPSVQLVRDQFGLHEASETEVQYFFAVCQRLRLDPITKQIHAVMRWDGRLKRKKLVIQIGIDGMRSIAARPGNYAGSDEAVFTGSLDYKGGRQVPERATVTVWKLVQGNRVPFTASAWWAEYCPGGDKGQDAMWVKMPHVMLAKCAEAQALRKAWPEDLGQIYTEEEMQQASAVQLTLDDRQVGILAALTVVSHPALVEAQAQKARTISAQAWEATLTQAVQAVAAKRDLDAASQQDLYDELVAEGSDGSSVGRFLDDAAATVEGRSA